MKELEFRVKKHVTIGLENGDNLHLITALKGGPMTGHTSTSFQCDIQTLPQIDLLKTEVVAWSESLADRGSRNQFA